MTPTTPVILAISRQIASGGAYVGQRVARTLGLRYVDREILQRAAEALGVDDASAEPFEERVAGFWAKLARSLFQGVADAPFIAPPPPSIHEGEVVEAETRIIRELARGDVVIVGRGAPHILRDRPGVIGVFIHAPVAYRVAEVQRSYSLDRAAAVRLVETSDRRRAGFVETVAGRPWTDATLYDLCIDTGATGLEAAAELVCDLVRDRLAVRNRAQ